MDYYWPGNVRQLENMIKRMVILATEAPILKELQQPTGPVTFRPSTLSRSEAAAPPQPAPPPAVAASPSGNGAAPPAAARANGNGAAHSTAPMDGSVSLKDIAKTAAREAERELILRMLTRTRWNRKEAAEILGISYKALLYKIKESGLDRAS
jgi:DNA-binding NtrC family response regulator